MLGVLVYKKMAIIWPYLAPLARPFTPIVTAGLLRTGTDGIARLVTARQPILPYKLI